MATTELNILMQEKKNGELKILYPVTKMENIVIDRKEISLDTEWAGSSAPYTKTIAVIGVTTDKLPRIYPIWSDDLETRKQEREEYSKISKVDSQANGIIITCDEEKPAMTLKIRLEVL